MWVGVLSDWGHRSSDRDRSRRRIARALVEHVSDRRSLALLVPPTTGPRSEAELVFPRTQVGSSNGAVTSVRAHLDLDHPTRFHRDLLRWLRIPPGASLLEVSRLWQQQFSVERVTTRFLPGVRRRPRPHSQGAAGPQPRPSCNRVPQRG